MRSFARTSLLLAAVLLLGACGGGGATKTAASSSSDSSDATHDSSTSKSSSTKSSSSKSSDSDSDSTSSDAVVLALSVDGLSFVTGSTTKNLDFGTAEATIRTALEDVLGKPAATDIGRPCDDGSSRSFDSIRYNGISAFFLQGKLSGWTVNAPAFTFLDGIGTGSTLADLKDAFGDVTVMETSLGTEWFSGTLGGLLHGQGDDATTTAIFNGELCIIR